MVPDKDGGANDGHSCVKGRFAWGYATPPRPRARRRWSARRIDRPVARGRRGTRRSRYAASRLTAIQAEHGVGAIGGITSSRCTNEEVFVVQKMIRAAFGNNNVDTCARVCHSPTGYGLKQTFGTSAGTQDFASVAQADVIVVIGANPTDGHPVFASRHEARLREGAELVVIDPRRIDLVRVAARRGRAPPAAAARHERRGRQRDRPRRRHRGARRPRVRRRALRARLVRRVGGVHPLPENSPEALAEHHRRAGRATSAAPPALYATAPNAAIYYGLGVTEHSQGSTMVMGMANLAMATGNIGRAGVGVNPLRGQNNVQGSCDMGSFPHELPATATCPTTPCAHRSRPSGARRSIPSRACASRTCSTPRSTAPSGPCSSRARTSRSPTRTPQHVQGRARRDGPGRRAGPVPQRDREVRPRVPAGHVVPREGRHVHQRRAPDQPRAPGDAQPHRASTSGRWPASSRRRWATRWTTTAPPRSWTRSRP